MSIFLDVLNLGYLSFTGVICYGALQIAQSGIGVVSLKTSFVAGLILGSLIELCRVSSFRNLKIMKDMTYFLQTSVILINIEESVRAFNLAKIFNVFEGARIAHAQSISLCSGILVVQAVGQIVNIFS